MRLVSVAAVPDETITRLHDALERHDGDGAAAGQAVSGDAAFGRLEHGAGKASSTTSCSSSI